MLHYLLYISGRVWYDVTIRRTSMAKAEAYTCDTCGKMQTQDQCLADPDWTVVGGDIGTGLGDVSVLSPAGGGQLDFCSDACLLKKLAELRAKAYELRAKA
jgi:hypothetical protein